MAWFKSHFGAWLRADISNALATARGEPGCPGGKELSLCLSPIPVLVTDFVVIRRAWLVKCFKQANVGSAVASELAVANIHVMCPHDRTLYRFHFPNA